MNAIKILFLVMFSVLFYNLTYAQIDTTKDYNFDQVPLDVIQHYTPMDIPKAMITVDGYDNFFMGIDFAEPHASMNPLNNQEIFTAWNVNNARWTTNGGLEWLNSIPNFGQTMRGDPVTAYDSLGNLYYESMYGSSSVEGAYVLRSTNNGATWLSPVRAIEGFDKNWLTADQTNGPYSNYVYTTMTSISTGGNFARSTNFGRTFVNTATFSTQSLPGMMPAVGPYISGNIDIPGGSVYVVTNDGQSYASIFTIYRSTDGGLTFQQRSQNSFANYVGDYVNLRMSVMGMRTRPYPFIAADNSYGPYRGRLYLVYSSNDPVGAGNRPDIFCRYSTDQGLTWSEPQRVNDDENTQFNYQWHSNIWCDKLTGKLYINWMDTRDTPSSDSAYIYATYSSDGGQTFASNQRISNQKMRINCYYCGGGGDPRYQGDYNSITSSDISFQVWTDFRYNSFGSLSSYFPDFAMVLNGQQDSLCNNVDSCTYTISVPSVKAYTDTIYFTVDIDPNPSIGTFDVIPDRKIITNFPDSITFRISSRDVAPGIYKFTFKGFGPRGIPVHTRTTTLKIYSQVPVELTSFTATNINNKIKLNWETATEKNNKGFQIERAYKISDNLNWEIISFVNGKGTTTEKSYYSFIDNDVKRLGKYIYRLIQIDYDGKTTYTNNVEVNIEAPHIFSLMQNYPNPFNPVTSIDYTLPEKSMVSIKIFDILGNEVAQILNEEKEPGNYKVDFDASPLASGIYFYRLEANKFISTKRMILLK